MPYLRGKIKGRRHMDILQAISERHSVRSYTSQPIEGDVKQKLLDLIGRCNNESGLNMQLVTEEPKAFGSKLVHYGKFKGVKNYIVMAGASDDEQKCGYYGQRVVLEAQTLGLNTCWVGLTYKKVGKAYTLRPGDKVHVVIAIGYGETQGVKHKIKKVEEVASVADGSPMPEWFRSGVEAALLAPTAMNQQKFHFTLQPDGTVELSTKWGFYCHVDMGIAKLHFELASGHTVASQR